MIGNLMSKEEVNGALVLALSGAIMALVVRADGPLSRGRLMSAVLSNPVPKKGTTGGWGKASVPDPDQQIAA